MTVEATQALVIGGGPAGLMAAEGWRRPGARVILADAKPSLGRKLLMARQIGPQSQQGRAVAGLHRGLWRGGRLAGPLPAAFGPDQVRAPRGWGSRFLPARRDGSSRSR